LRLEHNTVERKETNQNIYITSDEKIKRRLFHRKRKYMEVPHQYQILLYQESKNPLTTDQNLIESASH
jgi:hypothetical protein